MHEFAQKKIITQRHFFSAYNPQCDDIAVELPVPKENVLHFGIAEMSYKKFKNY